MLRRGGLAIIGMLTFAGAVQAADPGACRFAPAAVGQSSNALERLVALTSEQRGLGGTGIVAQREERGLGGTGIIGVVTGFGSICVNGFEIEVTQATAVTVEGLPANQGDVRLGQVVTVEAYPDGTQLAAARVDVSLAVAGPVSDIAADRSRMTVAGQTVTVAGFGGSADIADVAPGDWVAVSGLRRPDDSVSGSSIVKLPERGREVFVSGTARSAAGAIEIGSLQIAAPVTAGTTITVRGTLAGNVLEARAVSTVTASPFTRPMANLSIQAYGQNLPGEMQRLGVTAPAALAPNVTAPVQVDGALGAGGAFVPGRIETPPPPVDGAMPLPPPLIFVPVLPPTTSERPSQAPAPTQSTLPARPLPPGLPAPPPLRPLERPILPPDVTRPERTPPPERPERPLPPDRPAPPRPL